MSDAGRESERPRFGELPKWPAEAKDLPEPRPPAPPRGWLQTKGGQRVVGLLLFALGGGATAWSWYTALTAGYYYRKAVVAFPAFAVAGLGLLLFPIDADKLWAEHGVDRPQKFAHYPLSWKVLFVLALLAAVGNWLAISQE
ncbi:MAG TPA: hypothetical protein VFW33_14395 [Gemmataceae bacterium]|nr:hypothetical protein [Gemmataceae bacterium]